MNPNTADSTPARSESEQRFPERYQERETTRDPADVSREAFREAEAMDIVYISRQSRDRRIRVVTPNETTCEALSERFLAFTHDSQTYAYDPEARQLQSVSQTGLVTHLASGPMIRSVVEIEFPNPAIVVGTIEEDADTRVFYRSNTTKQINTVCVTIEKIDRQNTTTRMVGTAPERGWNVAFETQREREIKKLDSRAKTLGRVVRVEFPESRP